MGHIKIGAFIAAKRKERDLTQEELASYLGVSKPAVSKWESGQSYPDIVLLPVLAAYFNTSVDALLGYEAQLSKQEIKALYKKLSARFATEPFETVMAECRDYVKKYHACWNLLYAVSLLYTNHAMLGGSSDAAEAVLHEAAALLERVETESGEATLAKEALSLRAYCFLATGRAAEAIDLLGDADTHALPIDPLLAKAYMLKGDTDRAKELLQRFIYTSGVTVIAAMPDLMLLYADAPNKLDACLSITALIGDAFELRKTQPHHYFALYLTAAALFAALGAVEKALDILEDYVGIVTDEAIYPLKLRGSAFFDRIEPYFDTLRLGNMAPRSETLIKKDLKDAVICNPAFDGLKTLDRFRALAERLGRLE
ncbi:helix-turn-helix transcriptional regulator [Oscillospiraceae bacterium WX1]